MQVIICIADRFESGDRERQTDRQTVRQTDRQVNRQTKTDRHRQIGR